MCFLGFFFFLRQGNTGQLFHMVEQHHLKLKRKLMRNLVHSTRGTEKKSWLRGNKIPEVSEVRVRAEQDYSSVHPGGHGNPLRSPFTNKTHNLKTQLTWFIDSDKRSIKKKRKKKNKLLYTITHNNSLVLNTELCKQMLKNVTFVRTFPKTKEIFFLLKDIFGLFSNNICWKSTCCAWRPTVWC